MEESQNENQIITENEKIEAIRRMGGSSQKYRVERPKVVIPVEEVLDPEQQYVLISVATETSTCRSEAPQIRFAGFFETAQEAMEYLDLVFPDIMQRDCDWLVHPAGKPLVLCRDFRNQTNEQYIMKRYQEIMTPFCQYLTKTREDFERNLEEKKEGNIKEKSLEEKRRIALEQEKKKHAKSTRFVAMKEVAKRKNRFGTKPIKDRFRNPNNAVVCMSVVFDYEAALENRYAEPIIFPWISFPKAEGSNDPSEQWFQTLAKNAILDLEIWPVAGYEWLPITVVDLSKVKKVHRDSFVEQIARARELEDTKARNFQQACKSNKLKMKTTEFDVEQDSKTGKVKPKVNKRVIDYESNTITEYNDEKEEEQRKNEIKGYVDKTPDQILSQSLKENTNNESTGSYGRSL